MAHYINKDALVAEIERRMEERDNSRDEAIWNDELWPETEYSYRSKEDKAIIDFIDILEVKEVDLEKEVDTWRHNHFHGRRDKDASGEYLERSSQLDIAEHFFQSWTYFSN